VGADSAPKVPLIPAGMDEAPYESGLAEAVDLGKEWITR
jgi:hypothetical protein